MKLTLAALAATLTLAAPASAAQVEVQTYDRQSWSIKGPLPVEQGHNMKITGDIVPGDEQKVSELLPQLDDLSFIALNSHGGNVGTAMRIAEAIRARDLHQPVVEVSAYDECYSACFFILAAASKRAIDPTARIGVHQSSIRGVAELDSTLTLARLMRSWRVSPAITDAMLATPPGGLYILNKAEMEDMDTVPWLCPWGRCARE